MKKEHLIILSLIGLLLILQGFQFYYIYQVEEQLKLNTYTIKNTIEDLATNFDQKTGIIDSKIGKINLLIANESEKLESLKSETEKSKQNLLLQLDSVQAESEKSVEKLKEDIASINVQSSDFSEIAKNSLDSIVTIATETGQGSGVFVDSNGYIVTNYHVVKGASRIRILTYKRDVMDVRLVGADKSSDIAVLKAEGKFKRLKWGDSDSVSVGQHVIALGNPGGLSFTVTEGIISATDRKTQSGLSFIQTDVPINPGNSGGPLVSSKGYIIGINNYKLSGFEGLGFALNSNFAKRISDQIIGEDIDE